MMVKQYSCISKSIHNMSSLLWRHSHHISFQKHTGKQQKNMREREAANSFKTPDQRQV